MAINCDYKCDSKSDIIISIIIGLTISLLVGKYIKNNHIVIADNRKVSSI